MTLEQFNQHFEILNGYFDKSPKKSTSVAWFRELEGYHISAFQQAIERYSNSIEDSNGFIKFPHVGQIKQAIRQYQSGKSEKSEITSCNHCDHGQIVLIDKNNGLGYEYIFKCGECDQPGIKNLQPLTGDQVQEKLASGWELCPSLAMKYRAIEGGTWIKDDINLSANKVQGLLRSMGIGKEDRAKEQARKQNLEEFGI